jgi:phosphoglycerate dehydrogenase-like enzyme
MRLVIHPAVEVDRLEKILEAAGPMTVDNGDVSRMSEADAFFGKLTPELLAQAKRLQWVQAPTASLEHYLFPELIAHPCVLTNMRGLFGDVIAEQVMGYLLCFTRNLHRYVLRQARGEWAPVGGEESRVSFASGPGVVNDIDRAHGRLAGATLGVVGHGQIGQEVAQRARAFGMRVIATDSREQGPDVWPAEELPRLLAESDFVVIAAPHTPRTERLFDRAMLRNMKPSAVLVNVGRGAIVVHDDLVAALEAGELAGAALDVFEVEPLPASSPLWRMGDRVIVTPHVAGYSEVIAGRHLGVLLENLRRFARGEELLNVVNKAEWY